MIKTDVERMRAAIGPIAFIALAFWWFGLAAASEFMTVFVLSVGLPVAVFVAIASSSRFG